MTDINITPNIKYEIKLPEGTYYPAMLDNVEFNEKGEPYLKKEGVAGIDFYLPEKNKLIHKHTVININNLKNLNFPNLKEEIPKVFIHKGLAEILSCENLSIILPFLIKKVSEVENYKEYFNIFKRKEPRDIFSKYAGTALFPDK